MTNSDIIRYLTGQAGREEVAQIEAWIAESKENAITFHRWKSVWESASAIAPPEVPDVDQAWHKVLPKLERKPIPLYRRVRHIAAAVVLLLGLSYFGWPYFKPAPAILQVVTLAGETKQIDLPDGTKVWLNGNSKMDYPERFASKGRSVKLTGEAYFEVVRNETAPFLIEGNGSQVQVLGTSFVVQTHQDSMHTKVEVRSGKVALFPDGKTLKDGLVLRKDELGVLSLENGQMRKDSILDKNYLAWQDKVLVFNNTPMKEVEQTLEEVYKTKISIENPSLYNCTLTGKYDDVSLEKLLELFSFLFAAELVKDGKDFRIIGGNGC